MADPDRPSRGRLDSKDEEEATVAAERKVSKSFDVEGPTQAKSFLHLDFQGVPTSVPSPEPVPIDFKMVVEEDLVEKKENEKMKFNLSVFRFADGTDKALLLLGIIMNIANGCTMPIFMLVFGDMINTFGDPTSATHPVSYYVLIQVYIGIASFVVSGVGAAAIDLAAERQVKEMRHHYLEAVMRQEMGWFDTFDSGTLASRLNQNCVNIRDGIGTKLGQLFMFAAMFVGGYVVGFIRGWKMALVLSAALPLLAGAGFFMMKLLSSAEVAAQKAYSKAGSVAEEVLGSIRTVAAFGAEQKSILRYEVHLDDSMKQGVKGGMASGFGLGLTLGVMFLSYSLGFWYGGKLVADDAAAGCTGSGCFRGGNALSVFFAVVIAAFSLGQAGPPMTSFLKAGASAEDLLQLIDRQSKIDPSDPSGKTDVKLQGDIVFKNVQFRYPSRPEKPIFGGLDIHIPAGKTVALVGGSGCGKSTIIQMVQRFYDPDGGQVLIDGIDLKDFNLAWIRDQMSLVSQEPRLFARSIAENIRDGRLSATMQDVEKAAKNANALDFISQFPDMFDTFVGEAGSQLSGGQKQRIAIARAMLRDPTILILDEATSALDNESEKIVQSTLDALVASRKRTTIIIAHRLTTIRNADLILVLDNSTGNGAVVAEKGNHEELMAIPDGIYQNLVNSQKLQGAVESSAIRKLSRDTSMRSEAMMEVEKKLSDLYHKQASLSSQQTAGQSPGVVKVQKKMTKQETGKKKEHLGPKPPSYARVMSLLKPHWKHVAIGIIGSIIAGLTFPVFAIIYAEFINVYFLPDPQDIRDKSSFWACMFIILAASCFISSVMQRGFMEWGGQHIVRELRGLTFEKMLYQDMSFFDHPDHSTGSMSQILSSDVLLVKGWTGDNLGIIVQNVTSMVAGIIIAFIANAKLAAVALAAFLVMIPASAMRMKFMKGSAKEIEEGAQTAGYVINETIINIRIVTAYNLQGRMLASYDVVLEEDYKDGRWNALVGGFFWGVAQFIQFGAQALALWYGSVLMENGEIANISDMLRAIFALMMAAMGVGQSMVFVTDIKKAKEAGARVYEVIDREPLIDARSTEGKELQAEDIQGAVVVSNVNFRYPMRPDVPVFQNITFSIEAGQTVALVGGSGCGKSTVIQLLERFYDVEGGTSRDKSGGSVSLDGVDVRDATVKSLRSVMGLVSQEPILFNTTITENIRYGKPSATDEEVIEAAKKSNAHNFIVEFPDGYGTIVGKFGGQLSGGQKQRIAIARAMIRNPKILLLDEATSALDAESEKIVQAALDKLLAESKRTTIVVAHRLSTIQNADKIVVLANPDREGSAVVEVGNHEELMRVPDGVYRGLVNIAMAGDKKHQ